MGDNDGGDAVLVDYIVVSMIHVMVMAIIPNVVVWSIVMLVVKVVTRRFCVALVAAVAMVAGSGGYSGDNGGYSGGNAGYKDDNGGYSGGNIGYIGGND